MAVAGAMVMYDRLAKTRMKQSEQERMRRSRQQSSEACQSLWEPEGWTAEPAAQAVALSGLRPVKLERLAGSLGCE